MSTISTRFAKAVASTRHKYPFEIDAFVVLPDHMHAIWTLPPGDADFSTRWRLIKTAFAKSLPKQERLSAVRKARNERGIWQRRFWEHMIRNETDYARHIDVLLHQSREARPRDARARLAAFVVSPRRRAGNFSRSIGRAMSRTDGEFGEPL